MEKDTLDFLRFLQARPGHTMTKGMKYWETALKLSKASESISAALVRLVPIDKKTVRANLTEAGKKALESARV